ncbi:MAG: DUF99 family protein [Myxococcota bacterium]
MARRFSNCIGFDDGPFARDHEGDVLLVGVVCARTRLDGVLTGRVRKDGDDATGRMREMIRASQFDDHIQAVLLKGIAVAGFNVVDVHALARDLGVPVLVVARRPPDLTAIRRALARVPDGERKWDRIERAGPMEPLDKLWVQRVGLSTAEARALLRSTNLHGNLPEPLRLAHLIAGGVASGISRGQA